MNKVTNDSISTHQYKGYSIQEKLPTSFKFGSTIKGLWEISTDEKPKKDSIHFYKIYIISQEKDKYLLKKGLFSHKKINKIKLKSKTINLFPNNEKINIQFHLYRNSRLLFKHNSPKIEIIQKPIQKSINIHSCSFYNQVLMSNNPIILWFDYSLAPLCRKYRLDVIVNIISKGETIVTRNGNIKVNNPTRNNKEHLIKSIQIPIPQLETEISKYNLEVKVKHPKDDSFLFSKNFSINALVPLFGLFCEGVKYNEKLQVNQVSYMIGKIINNTSLKVKGKAEFHFIFAHNLKRKCFSRKLSIDPSNYEIISEDIMLPVYIGGHHYHVYGQFMLKTSKGSVSILNQTNSRLVKIDEPFFIVNLKVLIRDPPVKPNDKIPISIDIRLRDEQFQHKTIECKVILNYENLSNQVLHKFVIKKKYNGFSQFNWKVPNQYGLHKIYVKLFCDGFPIHENNIRFEPYIIDLLPKSTKK